MQNIFGSTLNKVQSAADFYNPEKLFCDDSICYAHEKNYPLFYDDDHLSSLGAKKMSKDLIKFMNNKNLF